MDNLLQEFRFEKDGKRWKHPNGWWVEYNKRSVKIGPAGDPTFKHIIDGVDKGLFTANNRLPRDVDPSILKLILRNMDNTCSYRLIRKQKRAEAAARRRARKLKPKRSWCKGCTLCPEGVDFPKCSKLKYSAEYAHWYCTVDEAYSRFWCANAYIVRGSHPALFEMHCKLTERPCPYNQTTLPGRAYPDRNDLGEHYTTCKYYKEV